MSRKNRRGRIEVQHETELEAKAKESLKRKLSGLKEMFAAISATSE